jgi:DNA-directed RNA polymerase specialized sigma24 family protein
MEANEILKYAKQLDSPYKEVLQLYYQENISQKEITERLGISLYKVQKYLHKGLYLVREASGCMELKQAKMIFSRVPDSFKTKSRISFSDN